MNNGILCNLSTGKIGGIGFFTKRPIAYFGETTPCHLYFEDLPTGGYTPDLPDSYAYSLENMNKSGLPVTVKVGERGKPPVVTQTTWNDFSTTPAFSEILYPEWNAGTSSPEYAKTQLRWTIIPTLQRGFYRFGFDIALHDSADPAVFGNGIAAGSSNITVITPAAYAQVFKSTIALPWTADEIDIEDAIRDACRISLNSGSYTYDVISASGGTPVNGKVPPVYANFYPEIEVRQLTDNEFLADLDFSKLIHSQRIFEGSSMLGTGHVDWSQKDQYVGVELSNFALTNVDGGAAYGKSGSLDFSAAAFGTLLGTKNEITLWVEVLIDGKTVADGPLTLKKREA